jgi:hypothetical protein
MWYVCISKEKYPRTHTQTPAGGALGSTQLFVTFLAERRMGTDTAFNPRGKIKT